MVLVMWRRTSAALAAALPRSHTQNAPGWPVTSGFLTHSLLSLSYNTPCMCVCKRFAVICGRAERVLSVECVVFFFPLLQFYLKVILNDVFFRTKRLRPAQIIRKLKLPDAFSNSSHLLFSLPSIPHFLFYSFIYPPQIVFSQTPLISSSFPPSSLT